MTKARRSAKRNLADPEIFQATNIACSSTTSANTSIFLNNTHVVRRLRFHPCTVQVFPGAVASCKWFVLRRVPAGYTAPSLSPSSAGSTTTIADQPNVLGLIAIRVGSSGGGVVSIAEPKLIWRKKSVVLYEGDSVSLTSVSDVSDTGGLFNITIPMEIETIL